MPYHAADLSKQDTDFAFCLYLGTSDILCSNAKTDNADKVCRVQTASGYCITVSVKGCMKDIGPDPKELPNMMSALEGGGGHGKADIVREVA